MTKLSEKDVIKWWRDDSFPGSYSGAHTFYKELVRKFGKPNVPKYVSILTILQKIPAYQVHASYKDKKQLLHITNVDGVGLQLHIDLAVLDPVNDYKGYLLAVDPWNNFVRTAPFKSKHASSIRIILETFLKEPILKNLQSISSDEGGEFIGNVKYFKQKHNISWFFLKGEHKDFLAELYIRFTKNKSHRYLRDNLSKDWVSATKKATDNLNDTYNSFLGMTPREANSFSKDPEIRDKWEERWKHQQETDVVQVPKYRVNTPVFKKMKEKFIYKGYDVKSGEIFRIAKVDKSKNTIKYYLKDLLGDPAGWTYQHNLKRAPNPDTYYYAIEEIKDTKKVNGKTMHLVKWLFYPDK